MDAATCQIREENITASGTRKSQQPWLCSRRHSLTRTYSCASSRSTMAMTRLYRLTCGTSVHLLMMLGSAVGGRERQALRASAQAFVVPHFDAALNLDRLKQAFAILNGNDLTPFSPATPRGRLVKLRQRLHGHESSGQTAAKHCSARRGWCVPCRGIAGPAPWKSQSSRNQVSSCPAVARGLQEGRRTAGWGGLSGRASAGGSERRRLAAVAKRGAASGTEGTMEDSGEVESDEGGLGLREEDEKNGRRDSWVKNRWRHAWAKIKREPLQILTIPVSAAFVGWITNKLAVEMIFHPLIWRGIPLRVIEGQPFGLIGWQGIVPAKAGVMAERMVDMVTTQLVDVEEATQLRTDGVYHRESVGFEPAVLKIFRRLSPGKVARLLGPEINTIVHSVFDDLAPRSLAWLPGELGRGLPYQAVDELKGLRRGMLVGLTKDIQDHVHKVLDLKDMVVGEMLRDRSLMVSLFQRCGKAEFAFLVNSGFFFGFLLGVVQMFVWLVYDKPWTLPAGGAVVGYLTNWLAIKLIFEPVNPIKVGPFVLQGLFLKRQNEVAADFAEFFANNVLTSQKLWGSLLDGSRAEAFSELVAGRVVPFVSRASAVAGANLDPLTVKSLAGRAAEKLRDHVHVLHDYTDKTLALRETMTAQMQKMSTRTFEGVLHPVFQEEEFILIVAGAILGTFAGFLQMLLSTKGVREAAKGAAAKAAETAAKAADGVVEAGGELVGAVKPAQVAQAAQKTAFGWKERATLSTKRYTSSSFQVFRTKFFSLFAFAKAAAIAAIGCFRGYLRGFRRGSDATDVPPEATGSDCPAPAPSETGHS